jgi:hypothetical protein
MRSIQITPATLVPKKLACLASYTREMAESSNIEELVRVAISESAGLALDQKMFSNDVGTAAAPAGLLYNVTPLTAATGGGATAMAIDIAALISALGANGAGAAPVIIAAVAQATSLKLFAGPRFDIPILPSAVLAKTVIAVEPSSFISGFASQPDFSTSSGSAVVHEEDTSPAPIVGSSGTAAPVRSFFQTDVIGLKCILRGAWALRAKHVAVVNNTTW